MGSTRRALETKEAELLRVRPTSLRFGGDGTADKPVEATLSIENAAPHRVAFRVQTNRQRKYTVKPAGGFLAAGEAVQTSVRLFDGAASARDKFLVQAVASDSDDWRAVWLGRPGARDSACIVVRCAAAADDATPPPAAEPRKASRRKRSSKRSPTHKRAPPPPADDERLRLQHDNDELRRQAAEQVVAAAAAHGERNPRHAALNKPLVLVAPAADEPFTLRITLPQLCYVAAAVIFILIVRFLVFSH